MYYADDEYGNYYQTPSESSDHSVLSIENYRGKKIEFTYDYDHNARYTASDFTSSASDSVFDFDAFGMRKDPGTYSNYRDYEVDTKYEKAIYDTYENYSPVDAFNSMYTQDYLADQLGFDDLGIVPKVYESSHSSHSSHSGHSGHSHHSSASSESSEEQVYYRAPKDEYNPAEFFGL